MKQVKYPKYFVWTAFSLVIWAFLGLFHMKLVDLGVFHLVKLVELIIIAAITPKILDSPKTAFLVLYLSSLFQAVLGMVQFHVQHSLGLRFLGEYIATLGTPGLATIDIGSMKLLRAYGTFPHPNLFGAFLLIGLAIGLYYVSHETWRIKPIWQRISVSCGTILIGMGILVSFSRLVWAVSLMFIILFLAKLVSQKKFRNFVLIVLMVCVSCGTVALIYPETLKNRAIELNSTSNSIVLRESFNRMGIQLFKEAPLTGNGIGTYVTKMRETFTLADWQYQPAHNVFIVLAMELGLIGLGLFLFLIGLIFRFTWNNRNSWAGFTLLSIFLAFFVLSNFDHYFVTIQQGELMLFSILGLMLIPLKE